MSLQIEINTKGLDDWADPADLERKHENFFKKVGVEGQQELQKETKKIYATGQLWRSVKHKATPTQAKIQATTKYATEALETGTPPGRKPSIKALKVWASKKGIPQRAVFPIAQKIKRSGTRKYRKRGPKQVTATFNKIREAIVPRFISEIEDSFA